MIDDKINIKLKYKTTNARRMFDMEDFENELQVPELQEQIHLPVLDPEWKMRIELPFETLKKSILPGEHLTTKIHDSNDGNDDLDL